MRGRGVALALALGVAVIAAFSGTGRAEWTPSPELRFRAELAPDTLTVGDPTVLALDGSAPSGGDLLVPTFADSVGPLTLLRSEDLPGAEEPGDRVAFARRLRLTAFRTGRLTVSPIPLLWVGPEGDTLVAYSDSLVVEVRSVLPDSVLAADPQAALAQLRDVKGVVPLEPSRLWLWILLAVVLAGVLAWLTRRLRRRRPAVAPAIASRPPAPPLPPEIAFHKGLDALLQRKLVEKGEFKEYYARLSFLLRRYIEGRFGIPAVEETEREIVEAASLEPRIDRAEVDWLQGWLRDADLVKFARLERLSAEAARATEDAAEWVRRSTRQAEERARASSPPPPASGPPASGLPGPPQTPGSPAGMPTVPGAVARSGSGERAPGDGPAPLERPSPRGSAGGAAPAGTGEPREEVKR